MYNLFTRLQYLTTTYSYMYKLACHEVPWSNVALLTTDGVEGTITPGNACHDWSCHDVSIGSELSRMVGQEAPVAVNNWSHALTEVSFL